MKDWILQMAHALVDYPEFVQVVKVNGGHRSIFQLTVSKQNMGSDSKNHRSAVTLLGYR